MTARCLWTKVSSSSLYYIQLHFNFPHQPRSEAKFSLREGNYIALNCRKWDDEATYDLGRYQLRHVENSSGVRKFGNVWSVVTCAATGVGHVKGNV